MAAFIGSFLGIIILGAVFHSDPYFPQVIAGAFGSQVQNITLGIFFTSFNRFSPRVNQRPPSMTRGNCPGRASLCCATVAAWPGQTRAEQCTDSKPDMFLNLTFFFTMYQPWNCIAGNVMSSFIGAICRKTIFPGNAGSMHSSFRAAVAVATAIAAMQLTGWVRNVLPCAP
jgi:hypothetical protein